MTDAKIEELEATATKLAGVAEAKRLKNNAAWVGEREARRKRPTDLPCATEGLS